MQAATKLHHLLLLLLLLLVKAEWTVKPGTDCSPGEGGVAIGQDSESTSISKTKCLAACEQDQTCVAVVRRADDESGPCYMRSSINLVLCVASKELEVHMLNRDNSLPSLSALEAQQAASGLEKGKKKATEGENPSDDRFASKIASSTPVLTSKMSTSQQRSTSWQQHRGTDCYEGKGGQPLSPDPYHRSLTLEQCQAACAQDSRCKGIIRKAGERAGVCYRRRSIQLTNCVKDATWDLFVKKDSNTGSKGWKERSGLDCYAGKGGLPIQPDPFSTQLAVADCRAACDSRPSCEGIVTGTSGQCYLRTQLDMSKCVRDPSWTLHLAPRFSGPVSPPKTTTRRPSGGFGCVGGVQSYPRSLPNSHYYRQLCTTSKGLRIVSAGRASGRALERTAFLLSQVTAYVDPRVTASMTARGFRHAVMARYPAELTTHLPEHAFLDPGYWNERARGLGATVAVPLGSSAEENALCDSNDRYRGEDITVHEFAHSLHLLGFALVFPNFNRELQGLYNAARAANVWGGSHYAMTDFKEYFAEGVQSFFNCNMADSYAPTDRSQLSRRDPNLYAFLLRYLGNNTWSHSC